VRLQLNDCGATVPAGHRIRLALSTSYWPMIWPAPEAATVTVLGGTFDLPVRAARREDATLPPLPGPQTAMPASRPDVETAVEGKYALDIRDDDPLAAVAEMRRGETKRRGDWHVRFETSMRLSCTRDAFLLRATLAAHEADAEVCRRQWTLRIPRDLA
jgi:hypothetical protein